MSPGGRRAGGSSTVLVSENASRKIVAGFTCPETSETTEPDPGRKKRPVGGRFRRRTSGLWMTGSRPQRDFGNILHFREHFRVEVAGIEPASFDDSTGLLRAQLVPLCRALYSPPATAERLIRLDVPCRPSTQPLGKPYLMTPVPDP